MLPDKPIIWFVAFVAAIFATNAGLNYAMGESEPFFYTVSMSILTGACTIGFMYLADEIRVRISKD